MRTRAVASSRVAGSTNVVSDRFICRASACIAASDSPRASSNTHSGFPENRSSSTVNTLTMRNAWLMSAMYAACVRTASTRAARANRHSPQRHPRAVDSQSMRFAVLALIARSPPYVWGGVDSSWRVHGPLATVVNQTVAARATTAGDVPAIANGNSYAFEVGSKYRDFDFGFGFQAHDVTSASFSLSSTGPHYLTATGSLDVRWNWPQLPS